MRRWEKQKSTYPWKASIDYRQDPEKYRVGKGEQGVLLCEPYKSEILPFWRFKNPQVAAESAEKIATLFNDYLKKGEFVGADMARKFLQMGYTRSRRYANHKGGRKYGPVSGEELPLNGQDQDKVESAQIFYQAWRKAESHPTYHEMKQTWKQKYG
ncbi:DUF4385 domain-containing protein [Candidatus Paracaedibacter acanthamoebae]|uniref:Cytoplasmic protein n=1 Tax=Candidatus Odyssella acanthamoebae TaxID=91604 RepID=A0A077AZ89_9PROT|nr:hypothetical protein ID47_09840 [Candidatus Paracaedibacter acanthamoebae]